MPARILSGNPPATALLASLRTKITRLKPKLTIILVGDDKRSAAYVRQKLAASMKVGIKTTLLHLPASTSRSALEKFIDRLNADSSVHGILLQLPLPSRLEKDSTLLTARIDPRKDVDGLTPHNLGTLVAGTSGLQPATAAGVVRLLKHYKIPLAGKRVVVIGRSALVGKPLALLLLGEDATVTVCHSRTPKLGDVTKTADILISAVGKPKLVKGSMLKRGAVIIDVGITATDEGLVGDADAPSVKKVASALSPVPGGVGPMTVASLIANCVSAAENL